MTHAETLLTTIRRDRGEIPDKFRHAADLDPEALRQFHGTYMQAMGGDSALPAKMRQLILVAVDAATYFHYGCRFHMAEALREGATLEEITGALRLAGLAVGFHAPLSAYPLLAEVLDEHGRDTAGAADVG